MTVSKDVVRFDRGRREARRFTEIVYGPRIQGIKGFKPSKSNARAVALALGVRVPEQYATFESPDAVDFDRLPDRFVLKADNMASKRGVYLLQRRGEGYFEIYRRKLLSRDWFIKDMKASLKEQERPDKTLVHAEEFIIGENGADQIPFDYKLYTFDGVVEYILQVDRNTRPQQGAFFRRGFTPMEDGMITYGTLAPGRPVRPRNWQQMLDVARRVSEHLDVPFIRVDLYTSGEDVIMGELTPKPGGTYYGSQMRFSDAFDLEMGGYWRKAIERRGAHVPKVRGLPPVLVDIELETAIARGGLDALRARAQKFGRKTLGRSEALVKRVRRWFRMRLG